MNRITSPKEANREYMSNSQYKNFLNCEAMAMASILGEYTRPTSNEFLAGSFCTCVE